MERRAFGSYALSVAMASELLASMRLISYTPVADFSRPKTRRTGKKYPFSSKRQNDRYARQITAGKLQMAGA